jgi:hypothetical protein
MESKDIADQHAEQVKSLKLMLNDWYISMQKEFQKAVKTTLRN